MTDHTFQLDAPPEPSSLRLVATLATAGLFSGLAIVGAHVATLPIIEANNARALEQAVFKVVRGAERMQGLVIADAVISPAAPGQQPHLFAAYDHAGAFLGYAVPGEGPGFQDTIRLIYGYDPARRRITGMEILESRETPGLGDKIYKDQGFVGDFADLSVDPRVTCVKSGEKSAPNEVDAITGATISSKAVVSIINAANDRWLQVLPEGEDVPPLEQPAPRTEPPGGAPQAPTAEEGARDG